jgi:O-antigen/teichoic acid export membrane protein
MNTRLATYAASSLLSGIASLLSVLVLSRLLPAEQYGRYATVLVLAGVVQTAGFHWLQSSIIRLHPEAEDDRGRALFAHAVRVGLALSTIAVAVAWTVGLFVLQSLSIDGMLLGVGGLSVLLSGAWAGVCLAWNRLTGPPWRFVTAQALQALGGLGLAIGGLAWRPEDPLVALGALVIASLLAAAVARFPVAGTFKGIHLVQPQLRQIWIYGAPLTAVALGHILLATSDRLLIAGSLGPAAAGAYAAASGIAGRALGLLLPPIALAVRPQVFIEFEQRGEGPARQLLNQMSGWLIALGLPVTILFVCAPHLMASAIIGSGLADAAAEVLPWTAIGALLSALLTLHFATAFQIAHRTKRMLLAIAPAAAFNLLSNALLLPRFGIVAAGWSIVAAYAIALALTIRLGNRYFRVPFAFSDALRTAAACVPLVAFLQLDFQRTTSGFILVLGGGALVYAGSAVALNVVDIRRHLTELARKFTRHRNSKNSR